MASVVPEKGRPAGPEGAAEFLGQALDALLEFSGAAAGWVGLVGPDGRLTFPVRRGDFPEAWLTLQQGQGNLVWGFEVREVCALPGAAIPALGGPSLGSLLSCPLLQNGVPRGQIVLASKPGGFAPADVPVLQAFAHLMSQSLSRRTPPPPADPLPRSLRRALERCADGAFVVDGRGLLVYANPAWVRWTGFGPEELLARPAPFPFWVSHRQIAECGLPDAPWERLVPQTTSREPHPPVGPLPFNRKNGTPFWCQVETCAAEHGGRPLTVAFLRQTSSAGEAPAAPAPAEVTLPALAEGVPLAVALVDRRGRVAWNNAACEQTLAPSGLAVPGQHLLAGRSLRDRFAPASAAAVDRLVREAGKEGGESAGSYILQRADRHGQSSDLVAYWLTVPLPDGPGLLFAFTEDWESLWPIGEIVGGKQAKAARPAADWLALLLRPEDKVEFWDERWERLTGLNLDPADRHTDLVLDYLFTRQGDRQWVEEVLGQPVPRGGQAVLPVECHGEGRPLLCTFLPVPDGGRGCWLLLAGEPDVTAGSRSLAARFLRPFARGLIRLLNAYLKEPIELAESAQERGDVPPPLAALFDQILESCHRAAPLIAALRDLAADSAGETQLVSLTSLVREYLQESSAGRPPGCELVVTGREGEAPVRVNRRMIKVVLGHLLSNAEHAVRGGPKRRIEVRVWVRDDWARCEVRDTGEGLATADPTLAVAPFYSTKGPFAKADSALAALPATGLGLTVSQHLLDLHGGRLELHSHPNEGTTAVMLLPRGDVPAGGEPENPSRTSVRAERKHPPAE